MGLSKPPANTAISFPGQQEARALVGFSAKAFPLSEEQLLYSELPLPPTPHASLNSDKQHNREALFGDILAWGPRERASQRSP